MKYPSKVIEEWIDACKTEIEAGNPKFNDFDREFIESIADRFDRTGYLTEPQIDKLEEIYANKTP